jgi:hypothetical protein
MRYVILGVLLGLYLLKLSGFCFSQWAYVKDREITLQALRYMAERELRPRPAFQDVSRFLDENPACCRVTRWNDPMLDSPFLSALFGQHWFVVDITYPVAEDAKAEDPYYKRLMVMDCCGEDIARTAGIGVREGPMRK